MAALLCLVSLMLEVTYQAFILSVILLNVMAPFFRTCNGLHLAPYQFLLCLISEQHIFKIAIDYRGRHWKGIGIYSASKSINNKSFSFYEQTCIFEIAEAKTIFILATTFFNCSVRLFWGAHYQLIFVLHKDMLFYWVIHR